jgi:hypothetical protein
MGDYPSVSEHAAGYLDGYTWSLRLAVNIWKADAGIAIESAVKRLIVAPIQHLSIPGMARSLMGTAARKEL